MIFTFKALHHNFKQLDIIETIVRPKGKSVYLLVIVMSEEEFSIDKILKEQKEVQEDPVLLQTILSVFEFTQYLLDDDDNLTKSANLTASAKDKLDKRIEELFLLED